MDVIPVNVTEGWSSELASLSYRELQSKAKQLELPGNLKHKVLVEVIEARWNGHEDIVTRLLSRERDIRAQRKQARRLETNPEKPREPRPVGRPRKRSHHDAFTPQRSCSMRRSSVHFLPPVAHSTPLVAHSYPPSTHLYPPLAHSSPPLTYSSPPVTYSNPPVTYSNPPVTYSNPPVTYSNPPLAHSSPPVSYSNPPVTYSNPPVTYSNPPLAHSSPPATYSNPPATYSNPPLAHSNLPIAHSIKQLLKDCGVPNSTSKRAKLDQLRAPLSHTVMLRLSSEEEARGDYLPDLANLLNTGPVSQSEISPATTSSLFVRQDIYHQDYQPNQALSQQGCHDIGPWNPYQHPTFYSTPNMGFAFEEEVKTDWTQGSDTLSATEMEEHLPGPPTLPTLPTLPTVTPLPLPSLTGTFSNNTFLPDSDYYTHQVYWPRNEFLNFSQAINSCTSNNTLTSASEKSSVMCVSVVDTQEWTYQYSSTSNIITQPYLHHL